MTDVITPTGVTHTAPYIEAEVRPSDRVYQAFQALHLGYIVAPLVAGIDKFSNTLADWTKYLAPEFDRIIPGTAHQFMYAVGVIEIAAGVLVAFVPRIGGYIVSAWLVAIIVNLVVQGEYYDVALRDLGLALGAFALGRLAQAFRTAHR